MTKFESARPLDRRTFLLGACAAVLAACSESGDDSAAVSESSTTTSTSNAVSTFGTTPDSDNEAGQDAITPAEAGEVAALTPEMFTEIATCRPTPSSSEGPFPSLALLDRRDIHEGYPGHPLRLGVRVVDADCEPVSGAQVDIWHTDATGDYSSYTDDGSGKDEGDGSTFCRGLQTSDENGILEFQTIYPGWYEGRAVHIHFTIRRDGQPTLTGQLYFDEAYTEAVHVTGEYAEFGPPDTPWSDDGLIGDPTTDGTGIALSPAATYLGDGTLGLINLSIET